MPRIYVESDTKLVKNKSFFSRCFPERVVVVPTLSQFEEGEKPNDPEYVRSVEYTRLAARNFHNIWRNKSPAEFEEFRELVSAHWPGIEVHAPELNGRYPPQIQMFFQENGLHREIYWSGFGFQAWLQMMTHFLRGEESDILVLDEPDVYLHADLQRRLFHVAKKRFKQIFIATHSAELMNEANAADVILIKPGLVSGARITSDAGYRSAHALLGSSENADFARLARAKRIVAFEGNDRTLFKRFEQKVLKGGVLSDPDTLSIKIGGYEHWHRVDNLTWMFKELFGMEAKIVALFDRDYRSDAEIDDFQRRLSDSGVVCRVLQRKELENYLLETEPLCAAIQKAGLRREVRISEREAQDLIATVAEVHREDCLINIQSFATKYSSLKRDGRDPSTVLKTAKIEFDQDWSTIGFKKRIGGKQFLIDLNVALRDKYGINISNAMIADEFEVRHVDDDMLSILGLVNSALS